MKINFFSTMFLAAFLSNGYLLGMPARDERMTDCHRFRAAIIELEELLRKNDESIKCNAFYSKNNFSKEYFDEETRLKESKMRALKNVHYFKGLLESDYCTDK